MDKFRLREKCGTHTEDSSDKSGVYFVQPGQVVEGNTDLGARFPEKFDKVPDDAKVTAIYIKNADDGGQQTLAHAAVQEEIHAPKGKEVTPSGGVDKEALNTFETLKELDAAELKTYAAENEIDIGEARTKKAVLVIIAKSMGLTAESS